MTKLLATISLLFLLLSCENSKDIDAYKIYNTVLKEKVSTYGIMVNYFPYDRDYSEKERVIFAKKTKDSLIISKSLNYFVSEQLTVLDTFRLLHVPESNLASCELPLAPRCRILANMI